jgi:hypothetical protein
MRRLGPNWRGATSLVDLDLSFEEGEIGRLDIDNLPLNSMTNLVSLQVTRVVS